jgi:glutamate N-acetyltransferase/amino-acid N-acetyltransferase
VKLDPKSFKQIPGSICAARGFKCAAVFCDIKKLGTGKGSERDPKNDLALIVSDGPAAVAGMFTSNQICAAPVKISAERAAGGFAQAIVMNSGNANACTGRQGFKDARAMTRIAAEALAAASSWHQHPANYSGGLKARATLAVIGRRYKIRENDVLVCSTGRIGVPMPMKNVECGICACVPLLARSAKNARQVAEAIMTTDTRRKEIAIEFKIGKSTVRIGGICKGAGMIQPGLVPRRTAPRAMAPGATHATMLAFITSDVAIESNQLKRALRIAVEQSFNRITVDGDMSTNDSVIMLANGFARNSRFEIRNSKFQEALNHVCLELAKMIVRDGEGVSRFVTLHVRGARSRSEAEAAARSIANSSLVRTSWCGGDPNWGRILCALGQSNARVDETIANVGYARPGARHKIVFAFRRGRPTNTALKRLAKITSAPEFDLYVDLHLGSGEFTLYASDLTEDYVALNKGDVNDLNTLGG